MFPSIALNTASGKRRRGSVKRDPGAKCSPDERRVPGALDAPLKQIGKKRALDAPSYQSATLCSS